MDKHTAGPWGIYTPEHDVTAWDEGSQRTITIAIMADDWEGDNAQEIREANARLIASAPELLEALKEVLELASGPHELCEDSYCDADWFGDGNLSDEIHKVLEKAVQLIDKVEGSE